MTIKEGRDANIKSYDPNSFVIIIYYKKKNWNWNI